jgi:hypothetical protein
VERCPSACKVSKLMDVTFLDRTPESDFLCRTGALHRPRLAVALSGRGAGSASTGATSRVEA